MTFIGHALVRLSVATVGLAPRAKKPDEADDEGPLALWHWIEDHGDVVFPLIGLIIFVLVVIAVRRAMVSQEQEIKSRRGQMDTIVRLMRAKLSLTADQTATELGINRYQASTLLDELVKEGALVQGRLPGGVVNYRLKGL